MDVSIVVTAYNYAAYLEGCIASCLAQDPAGLRWEVIVVDDGSTDDTPAVLARCQHPQLRSQRIPNSGIEAASNLGFELAQGRHVVRVDADDRLLPGYLKALAPHLGGGHAFLYGDYGVIDGQGQRLHAVQLPAFDPAEVRGRGDFLATGTLYDASVLRALGGYDTTVRNSGLENFELMLRLLQAGHQGLHLAQEIFEYRRHGGNLSDQRRERIIANGHALCAQHGLGPYRTNAHHPYQLVLER